MKTMILSAVVAAIIHAALFTIEPSSQPPQLLLPKTRSVTITLKAVAPEPVRMVEPLPVSDARPISPLKPLTMKKPPPKPKPEPKPKPIPKPAPKETNPVVEHEPLLPDHVLEPISPTPSQDVRESQQMAAVQSIENSESTIDTSDSGDESLSEDEAEIKTSIPLYDFNPKPDYPSLAKRRNYQGTVVLEVRVDAEGCATHVRIISSCGYGILDRAARKVVAEWRFQPATRNDVPIESTVEVPIVFELKK